MDFILQLVELLLKTMDFIINMMVFILKLIGFILQLIEFILKLMNFQLMNFQPAAGDRDCRGISGAILRSRLKWPLSNGENSAKTPRFQ